MQHFTLTPSVDETQEFIEIANDFSNPLEVVREAISNSFDARQIDTGLIIKISFSVVIIKGRETLRIELSDNGTGMDRDQLKAFFDLGNSPKRSESDKIGEKGHGTKVFFNSNNITVTTIRNGTKLVAEMNEPYSTLFDRRIPTVNVTETEAQNTQTGTDIVILGYNNNNKAKFTHEILKDYILWFTKFGSVEKEFGITQNNGVQLSLKGLNADQPEILTFGHFFPQESLSVNKLFDVHLTKAPEFYCKKIVKTGHLKNSPEVKFEAVFYIEGNKIKQSYNPMLRRPGYAAPDGGYTVQERYGLWLCKDYMPIQKKSDWITYKGAEYTKFHAFINCQKFRLTANRGSVDNTPSDILNDIRDEVKKIFDQIAEGDDWRELVWLEEESEAYRTSEKEKKDFEWRINKVNRANIAEYNGLTLIPART